MQQKRVHFMGLGGSGISAIAAIAQAQGFKISGCDEDTHSEFFEAFNEDVIKEGHSPEHLEGVDILAMSPAIPAKDPNNPELQEARERDLEILTWQQFMGKYLEEGKFVIAVCGTHGKSTTTAMAGLMLEDAHMDPTVELGAIVPRWQSNYRLGKSRYFVTEADEFNDNFLATTPDIAIVTTIEMDHPEYFANLSAVKKSYRLFLKNTRKAIIANISDPGVKEVVEQVKKDNPSVQIIDYSAQKLPFHLKIAGSYNILNATAVYELGRLLGIDSQTLSSALIKFEGIGRRFEYIGKFKGADVYSDFGHHPTEVRVTVETLREKFPDRKIYIIFQPHMFSRTKAFLEDFAKVLADAPVNQVLVMDIYPSREIDKGEVHSKDLVTAAGTPKVTYIGSAEETKKFLEVVAHKDEILFFIGAGENDRVARELVNHTVSS